MNSARQGRPTTNPPSLVGEYDPEITQESYKEMQSLAFWARGMGPEFYVIGGWAAWRYHSGLGSRDIDVVFTDRRILDMFLSNY